VTTALKRIQIGLESTRGTLVAADTVLLGALQYTDDRAFHMPEDEERNSLALLHRQTEIAKGTTLQFTGAVTFEQILQFLSMGVKGAITPTTPTNGVLTRDWTFLPTLTALNAPDSFTFEYGDDQQEYECGYVMAEQLELAFAMGEVGQLSANLFGKATAKSTFTGALSAPTVEDVVSQTMKFYKDTSWANLGNTEKAAILANATIRIPTGFTKVPYGDGSTEWSTHGESKRAAEVEITLRHNADVVIPLVNEHPETLHAFYKKMSGSHRNYNHYVNCLRRLTQLNINQVAVVKTNVTWDIWG